MPSIGDGLDGLWQNNWYDIKKIAVSQKKFHKKKWMMVQI